MAAYVIAIIDIINAEAYKEYALQVPATIARYGGRYLMRGGTMDLREGEWPGERTVIVEFPSLARAREWYDSPEYRPVREIRQANSRGRVAIFEGVASPTR